MLYLQAGLTRFEDYARAVVQEIGLFIRPYLRPAYLAARALVGPEHRGGESAERVEKLSEEAIDERLRGIEGPAEDEPSTPQD